ncbi:MAG TPA: hypothetical protein VN370_02375 [Desulfitobacteriaceae bacterium]|nr:hypothetical protein [Desulfitobacteriaceae bacterium]
MGTDIVREKLHLVQEEYKKLLINLRDNFEHTSSRVILDEINVFWFRNRKLIDLIFGCYFKPYRTYLFAAVGYVNICDNEHFPFLSLGDNHVLDDPIHKLMLVNDSVNDPEFAGEFKKHMFEAINDNICVLEQCFGIIYILPCSLLYSNDTEAIKNGLESSFLSMFRKQISLVDYFKSMHTIEDVRSALRPEIERSLIFLEDDYTDDFVERFNTYKREMPHPSHLDSSDGQLFFFVMSGYLAQALDVLYVSTKYQIIPYIRFGVALKYMEVLGRNFAHIAEIKDIIFKATIAYILHTTFDKELVEKMDLQDYLLKMQGYDFEEKLYEEVLEYYNLTPQPDINVAAQIINKHLFEALS